MEPWKPCSASSSASRAWRSGCFFGSSRIKTFAPDEATIASDSRRRSPPLNPSSGFLGAPAREQDPPEQRARLVGRQAGALLARLEDGPRAARAELLGVLAEVAELHVVAAAQLAAVERPVADQRLEQRRLAGAVRTDERHVLAALEPQLGAVEQDLARHLEAAVLELEDHAPRTLRRLEGERERAPVLRVARDALHLVELLHPRLRLARLARLVAEALDEPLHPRDLGLLALDRAPQRHLARGGLPPPLVP